MSQSPKNWRVLKHDGSLNLDRPRSRMIPLTDLYHYLLSISWPKFLSLVVVGYISLNFLFAFFYFFCGPQALEGINKASTGDRFWDCFFFSVQTIAAIGYGRVAPIGILANILVTAQAFLGMLILALVTGLFYARFARPTARVIFSHTAILGPYNGKPCFFFRVANERLNQIVEAHITLTLIKNEITKEGERMRKLSDLKLQREYSPIFALTWTVVHTIDESSPLFKMNEQSIRESQVEILAALSGLDATFSQTIHARMSYTAEDIVWNARFKDILSRKEDGMIQVNLKGIHEVFPS